MLLTTLLSYVNQDLAYLSLLSVPSLCAAPWYVYNTLMKSERRTEDPQKADVIFVYDYCRLMWALSEEHAAHHWYVTLHHSSFMLFPQLPAIHMNAQQGVTLTAMQSLP